MRRLFSQIGSMKWSCHMRVHRKPRLVLLHPNGRSWAVLLRVWGRAESDGHLHTLTPSPQWTRYWPELGPCHLASWVSTLCMKLFWLIWERQGRVTKPESFTKYWITLNEHVNAWLLKWRSALLPVAWPLPGSSLTSNRGAKTNIHEIQDS